MSLIAMLVPDFPTDEKRYPWFIKFHPTSEWAAEHYCNGNWLFNWKPMIGECPEGPDRSRDYMLSLNGFPLFSQKFRALMEAKFPESMQFLPVSYGSSMFQNHDTFIGQILHSVSALDRQHSKVDFDDWTPRDNGTYGLQYPFHLKRDIASNYPIFRIPEDPVHIFVRQDLRELIEQHKLTGFRFDFNVPLH